MGRSHWERKAFAERCITEIPQKIVNKEVPQIERGNDKDENSHNQLDTGETGNEKEIADIKECLKAMVEKLSENFKL